MLNQVILVGKVDAISETGVVLIVEKTAITKAQKLRVDFSSGIAGNVVGYLTRGSIIGVKAHLENSYPTVKIVAEKLTFIKSGDDINE